MTRKKRGQMKMSFGMIFSIILIIIFLAFAFYAIQKFLGLKDSVQVAKFANDLQADVDRMWRGSEGSEEKEYAIPGKIGYICFTDYKSGETGRYANFYKELEQTFYENENLFFFPLSSVGNAYEIKHVDIEKTTEENPKCFENIKGKVSFIIKKDFGETLATIE
ncbi:MAG TPA: hypothetical protein VJ208_01680 [Candidatus Nanoarchaeia archaeon]|nr:hypothetical protein [Candidatus Nanoarchaeia archaeon]